MAETREGRVRRAVTSALQKAGWIVIRTDAARNHSLRKGWPDLTAIKAARWDGILHHVNRADVVFIECKTPRYRQGDKVWPAGRLSKAQRDCIEWLRKRHYTVRVVRSVAEIHDLVR